MAASVLAVFVLTATFKLTAHLELDQAAERNTLSTHNTLGNRAYHFDSIRHSLHRQRLSSK